MSFKEALKAFTLGREEMAIEHEFGKLDKRKQEVFDATRSGSSLPLNEMRDAIDYFFSSIDTGLEQRRAAVHVALAPVEHKHPVAYLLGNLSRPYATFQMLKGFAR